MSEAPVPEQSHEKVVNSYRYNEPFPIIEPKLTSEVLVDRNLNPISVDTGESRFSSINIEGHPGYSIEVSNIPHVVDKEIRTAFIGVIVYQRQWGLLLEPFRRTSNRYMDNTYFSPFGPSNIESVTDLDDEGKMRFRVKSVPISIGISLNDIWKATEGKDQTRIFLIYKNKVIEGVPLPYDRLDREGTSRNFTIREDSWVNLQRTRPIKTIGENKFSSVLLLPSDPEFFKTAKILIGDKPPQLKS